ncbi:DUF3108 domain-containing protein [Beggiatoa alba]|nr:DUF3108 domain-containing protein [Beggiatoa alba]
MIKFLVLFSALISYSHASNANLFKTGFKVEYDVNYNGMNLGVSKRDLSIHSQQLATYETTTIPEGFAALLIKETTLETSNIIISRNQILPTKYTFVKKIKDHIEKHQLNFDWKTHKLDNSYLKTSVGLKSNTHDLLSFQLNIMRDLQQNKKDMHYRIATKKHTREYSLRVLAKEKIETALGVFEVLKLKSNKIKGKSQFTFWCAPILEYLPIKIQKINDKGDALSFVLRAFSVRK